MRRRDTESYRLDAGSDEEMIELLCDRRDNPLAPLINEMPAQAHDEVPSRTCARGGQVADLKNLFAPRGDARMRAQQRLHGSIEISLQEERLLRRAPVTGGGDNACIALQADECRREVEHYSLVAERIDAAYKSLDVTPARSGLIVNGKP
jgi:hypothetical protein